MKTKARAVYRSWIRNGKKTTLLVIEWEGAERRDDFQKQDLGLNFEDFGSVDRAFDEKQRGKDKKTDCSSTKTTMKLFLYLI
jgi:hypothetical protein